MWDDTRGEILHGRVPDLLLERMDAARDDGEEDEEDTETGDGTPDPHGPIARALGETAAASSVGYIVSVASLLIQEYGTRSRGSGSAAAILRCSSADGKFGRSDERTISRKLDGPGSALLVIKHEMDSSVGGLEDTRRREVSLAKSTVGVLINVKRQISKFRELDGSVGTKIRHDHSIIHQINSLIDNKRGRFSPGPSTSGTVARIESQRNQISGATAITSISSRAA